MPQPKASKFQTFYSTVQNIRKDKDPNSLGGAETLQNVQQSGTNEQKVQNQNVQGQTQKVNDVSSGVKVDFSNYAAKPTGATNSVQSAPVSGNTKAEVLANTGKAVQVVDEQIGKNNADVGSGAMNGEVEKADAARRVALGDVKTSTEKSISDLESQKNLGEVGTKNSLESQSQGINEALAGDAGNVGLLSEFYKNYDSSKFGAVDSNVLQGDISKLKDKAKIILQDSEGALNEKGSKLEGFKKSVTGAREKFDKFYNEKLTELDGLKKQELAVIKDTFEKANADLSSQSDAIRSQGAKKIQELKNLTTAEAMTAISDAPLDTLKSLFIGVNQLDRKDENTVRTLKGEMTTNIKRAQDALQNFITVNGEDDSSAAWVSEMISNYIERLKGGISQIDSEVSIWDQPSPGDGVNSASNVPYDSDGSYGYVEPEFTEEQKKAIKKRDAEDAANGRSFETFYGGQ